MRQLTSREVAVLVKLYEFEQSGVWRMSGLPFNRLARIKTGIDPRTYDAWKQKMGYPPMKTFRGWTLESSGNAHFLYFDDKRRRYLYACEARHLYSPSSCTDPADIDSAPADAHRCQACLPVAVWLDDVP